MRFVANFILKPSKLCKEQSTVTVITSATTTAVAGTLNSTANTTFSIEFFRNGSCDPSGFGEGETLLSTFEVTTNGAGDAPFALTVGLSAGQFVTATATDPAGNTSEFSACIAVP